MGIQNLSTRAKLLLSFGLMLALMGLQAYSAYRSLNLTTEQARQLTVRHFENVWRAQQILATEHKIRVNVFQAFMELEQFSDPTRVDRMAHEIAEANLVTEENLRILGDPSRHAGNEEFLAKMEETRNALAERRNGRAEILSLLRTGKMEQARTLMLSAQASRYIEVQKLVEWMVNRSYAEAQASLRATQQIQNETYWTFAWLTGLALALAVGLSLGLSSLIAEPLRAASSVAERITRGDLSVRFEQAARRDEVGVLQQALARMVEHLRTVHAELRQGTEMLTSAANEILASVSQVASGASETAASVSQTGATAQQVKQTAQLSNHKAIQVKDSSQQAISVSEAGRHAVDEAVRGMNEVHEQMETVAHSIVRLSEQSQSIGEIIATVGDLAEQSNVLAVNAALEATRAGDYGKGFGVVAQEVKSLAEQSRQATVQVRSLLMEIQKATSSAIMSTEQGTRAVQAGVRQASQAGNSIAAVVSEVSEASEAAIQIAASSEQQLAGMDQIASAMESIKLAINQNVAGTRQLEASARGLQEMGARLQLVMTRWQS